MGNYLNDRKSLLLVDSMIQFFFRMFKLEQRVGFRNCETQRLAQLHRALLCHHLRQTGSKAGIPLVILNHGSGSLFKVRHCQRGAKAVLGEAVESGGPINITLMISMCLV
jgi:hypothetical protein